MKQLSHSLWVLVCLAIGLTGCSSNNRIIASGLSVEVARIQQNAAGDVMVTLRAHNPNVVSYLFAKTLHTLTLDGKLVGKIEENSPQGLPAINLIERTAKLTVTDDAARQVIAQALRRGSATYRVESTVWVLIVDDDIEKISLSGAGTVTVSAE